MVLAVPQGEKDRNQSLTNYQMVKLIKFLLDKLKSQSATPLPSSSSSIHHSSGNLLPTIQVNKIPNCYCALVSVKSKQESSLMRVYPFSTFTYSYQKLLILNCQSEVQDNQTHTEKAYHLNKTDETGPQLQSLCFSVTHMKAYFKNVIKIIIRFKYFGAKNLKSIDIRSI